MKVLITGSTGFVGSHTVAAVAAAGHQVKLFVRSPSRIDAALKPHGISASDLEHSVGDVNEAGSVRSALEGCEAVIHAGSAYVTNLPFWKSSDLMKTNVQGTSNVLRAAQEMRLDPIVYVSSIWGIIQPKRTRLTEEAPVSRPPEPYPKSKAASEAFARKMQEDGAPVVITYPGGVWGPHDPYWGETAKLCEMILKGFLRIVCDGTSVFSDVREVASLHAALLTAGLGPRRYIVPSHSPRFLDVVDHIREVTGRKIWMARVPAAVGLVSLRPLTWLQKFTPFRLPVPYEGAWYTTRNNYCGETRAQREFGIEPRPFGETVRDTLEWMAGMDRMKPSLFGKVVS